MRKERGDFMLRHFNKDKLSIEVYATREEMGASAAKAVAECINRLLKKRKLLI